MKKIILLLIIGLLGMVGCGQTPKTGKAEQTVASVARLLKEGITSKVSTRKKHPTWIVVKTSNIPYPGYYNILRVKSDGSSGTCREVPNRGRQNARWGKLSDEDLKTIRQYLEDLHEVKLKPLYGNPETKAGTKVEFCVFDGEQGIKTTLFNHHIDIIDQITNLIRERIDMQTEEKNQQRIKKWIEEERLEIPKQDTKE